MKNGRWVLGGVAIAALAAPAVSGCGGSSATNTSVGGAGTGAAAGVGAGAGTAGAGANPSGPGGTSPGGAGSVAGSAAGGNAGADTGSGGSGGDSAGLGGTSAAGRGGSAGSGHGGSAGSGGHGGSAGSGTTGSVGQTCASDLDCGAGLTCLQPDDVSLSANGPANGLCTTQCLTNTDCQAVSPGAGCVNFGTANYCLESCVPGNVIDVSTKCHGRPDMACTGFGGSVFLCNPLCRADIECAAGQFCDPGTGLCSNTKPTGDPVGTPCDPTAATTTCLGGCLTTSAMGVTPATGVCAEICSGLTECMYSGTQPGGYCVGALSADFGVLDLGYCEPSCKCTANCKIPGDLCQAWTAADGAIAADLGSAGICYPNASGSTELTSCQ